MAMRQRRGGELENTLDQMDARLRDLSDAIGRLEAEVEALRAVMISRSNATLLLIGAFGTAILGALIANLFAA